MSSIEDDDGIPQLSGDALAALKDFYADRDSHQKLFEDLKSHAEADHADRTEPLTMAAFAEDWNASQFWYTQDTADALARSMLAGATDKDAIVFVSAPSAFLAAKNMLMTNETWDGRAKPTITLLEYDERFALFKEFAKYDYSSPLKLPAELRAKYTRILCDPPFLSDECQTKTALTVRWLASKWTDDAARDTEASESTIRLVICTGERMGDLVHRLYAKVGVKTTNFVVQHQKGLSNEFRCYANYTCEDWAFEDSHT